MKNTKTISKIECINEHIIRMVGKNFLIKKGKMEKIRNNKMKIKSKLNKENIYDIYDR